MNESREQKLESALRALLAWAEEAEWKIDQEWGDSRSLDEIEKDGDLPPEIIQARQALSFRNIQTAGGAAGWLCRLEDKPNTCYFPDCDCPRGYCPICGGDCADANPPVANCPMRQAP